MDDGHLHHFIFAVFILLEYDLNDRVPSDARF
ncbi:hypothetical protein MED222_04915 [Vibrio sp. MED222]|nr:hypothetical protein MED222_04915 [Vibrio sp. MED222]